MAAAKTFGKRQCRVCGRGEYDAGWWVERDLCDRCEAPAAPAGRPPRPRAAPLCTAAHWAPLPGSMSLAEAEAILAEAWIGGAAADIARRHGMELAELDAFVARNAPAPPPALRQARDEGA